MQANTHTVYHFSVTRVTWHVSLFEVNGRVRHSRPVDHIWGYMSYKYEKATQHIITVHKDPHCWWVCPRLQYVGEESFFFHVKCLCGRGWGHVAGTVGCGGSFEVCARFCWWGGGRFGSGTKKDLFLLWTGTPDYPHSLFVSCLCSPPHMHT